MALVEDLDLAEVHIDREVVVGDLDAGAVT